jgi:hypothetical protein
LQRIAQSTVARDDRGVSSGRRAAVSSVSGVSSVRRSASLLGVSAVSCVVGEGGASIRHESNKKGYRQDP